MDFIRQVQMMRNVSQCKSTWLACQEGDSLSISITTQCVKALRHVFVVQ